MNTQDGSINIKCKQFELDAGGKKLSIGPSGATLDCSPSIGLKSASITVEATGTNTVKGAVLNLESSGVANLKGSMVKIN
jgi:hypothetical protein